jgi:preprotein translocase SecE subunit
MAKEPTDKQSTKRRVKNPETFRERAVKASNEKPKRRSTINNGRKKYSSKVFGPIGRAFTKFANLPGVRLLKRPARILGKVLLPVYFRNSWKELKLVTWPSWEQSRRLTYAVLIFAIVFGATIATVDWGLSKIFRHILLK